MAPSTFSSSSRQWNALRNPRIVRMSSAFGGKDRHSKVCTVKGLRDRRIRLSIPTAIQLYDLQHKLGLSQPSKVIDWLIEVTKLDIDMLPPLQIPYGFHHIFHPQPQQQQTLLPHYHQFSLGGIYGENLSTFLKDDVRGIHHQNFFANKSSYWGLDSQHSSSRLKGKEAENLIMSISQKCEQENQVGIIEDYNNQELFLPGLLNNAMAYNNSYHSEPSSLSLSSQFGSQGPLFPSSYNVLPHQSTSGSGVQFASSNLDVPSGGGQLLFCPSSAAPASLFTRYAPLFMANLSEVESDDPRSQFNHEGVYLNL
ncbi:hypothetical protein RIF29_39793 [Crotalaria pallida]|uniref:TCP domain-containing protein n=1 Tax=Crotalaria pallida TaxID=3830 RepID=A0AAN9HPX9_CROPI